MLNFSINNLQCPWHGSTPSLSTNLSICIFHVLTYAFAFVDVLNLGGETKSLQREESKMLCCALEWYTILFVIFSVD
jgi:hypothetical protein